MRIFFSQGRISMDSSTVNRENFFVGKCVFDFMCFPQTVNRENVPAGKWAFVCMCFPLTLNRENVFFPENVRLKKSDFQ